MFDLEEHISHWRDNLMQKQSFHHQDLCELEEHLREAVTQLSNQGLATEEAFIIACRRLGDSQDLALEFSKVNPHQAFRNRLLWMCVGLLGFFMAAYVATGVSKGIVLIAANLGLRGYRLGVTAEALYVITLVGSLCGLLALVKHASRSLTMPRWLRPMRVKVILGFIIGLVDLCLFLAPMVFTFGLARIANPEDFGKMALVQAYTRFSYPIIGIFLLVGLVIRFRPRHGTT
ncbi:hypothetical protein ACFL6U_19425 [Planctomycetota bacterium]